MTDFNTSVPGNGQGPAPGNMNPADPMNQLKALNSLLGRFPGLAAVLGRQTDPRDARTVNDVLALYLEDCRTRDLDADGLKDKVAILDFSPATSAPGASLSAYRSS